MPKSTKHIIKFGYRYYAVDSISAATQAIALLAKLKPCEWQHEPEGKSHYRPIEDAHERDNEITLETNQRWHEPKPEKPAKAEKLPAPKRGSILCICERSYVAPRQSCPHCGRPFSESHNRTHGADRTGTETPKLL
ncbi:hypothetical protein [Haloferula sargassicola]|uniref:C2H2-type domain-containing protein n=1 Tax=Haloferula sargassicola TaxID=490096 RepID=A0ABP9ULC0_9BACT